jgi:hypothetical protein
MNLIGCGGDTGEPADVPAKRTVSPGRTKPAQRADGAMGAAGAQRAVVVKDGGLG